MNRLAILSILLSCLMQLHAQDHYCPTVPSEAQLTWLRNFQANLDRESLPPFGQARMADFYIPVQVHVVGDDDGKGYIRHDLFLESICKLNDDYATTGFHFYLQLPVLYHDNESWHDQDFSSGFTMISSNNVPNAVNLYYVYQIGEGTIAGYFSPSADGMVMAQSASGPGSNTLPHEFGHFFSLPHTFYRWEWGTPPLNQQEKVDGSNCTTAADGFCDTPPDYAPYRWNCPSVGPFVDPDSAEFSVVDSFFMSYGGNSCRDRFSPEQSAAMRGYLTGVHPDLIGSADPYFPNGYDTMQLINPVEGDVDVLPIGEMFSWTAVEDAVGYHVAVGYTSIFSAIGQEAIVTDTFWTATDLQEDRNYYWHVKPLFEGNTCEPYSETRTFRTGLNPPPATGIDELDLTEVQAFPQPAIPGSELVMVHPDFEGIGMVEWIDLSGKVVFGEQMRLSNSIRVRVPAVESGMYLVRITSDNQTFLRKVMTAR